MIDDRLRAADAAAGLARAFAEEGEPLSCVHTADAKGPPRIAVVCGPYSIEMNPGMAREFAGLLLDGADRPRRVMPPHLAAKMTAPIRRKWRELAEILAVGADGAEAAASPRH